MTRINAEIKTAAQPSTKGLTRLLVLGSEERLLLPDVYRTRTHLAWATPGLLDDVTACIEGRKPWPLLVLGNAGCGKTCAMLCVADRVRNAIYWELLAFCDRLIAVRDGVYVDHPSGRGGRTVTPHTLWADWIAADLAIMDELGRRSTQSDSNQLKRAVDSRHSRPTIFVSNEKLADLHRMYGDPVVSRLQQGTVFAFPAGSRDYRVKE